MKITANHLLLTALAAIMLSFSAGLLARDIKPDIRLSGTVNSVKHPHAFIEYQDGTVRLVTPGELVDDWGEVVDIQQGKIILSDPDGDLYEVLTEGIRSISGSDRPQLQSARLDDSQPVNSAEVAVQPEASHGSVIATPELMSEIYTLTRQNDSSGEDINSPAIARLLKLPAGVRIAEIDSEPLSKDNSSLLKIEQKLAQGSVVRLILQGDSAKKWIYLTPDLGL